jgi:hypothetical protein
MQVGQPITLSGVDSSGVGGIFASTLNKRYNIVAMDHTGYTFTADSSADSDAIGGGASVQSTKNILYSTIYPNITTLEPDTTRIATSIKTTSGKSYAGTETAFQKDTDFKTLKLLKNTLLPRVNIVAHDSAETTELGAGVKSLDMQLVFNSFDSNVAPVIDLQRSSVGLISNIIDKQASSITTGFNVPLNFTAETSSTGGSTAAKHLTRPIYLEEEAVGLKIILSAQIPTEADIEVYVRTTATDSLALNDFVLVPSETIIRNENSGDVFETVQFLFGGLGGDAEPFKQFQVKIVMRSTNQAAVPELADVRVIALSV